MWKSYPEYNLTIEGWINDINKYVGYTMYNLDRALRIMHRTKLITKEEQRSLLKMLSSTDEDKYIALTAIDNKYKQLTKIQESPVTINLKK
jgi:hypothetical protein